MNSLCFESLFRTGNQLLQWSLRSGKPGVRHDEELQYLGPSDHLRTLRSFNLAILTTFCAQTFLCPWIFQLFSEANTSRWLSLPSLQDGDCAGTLRTWRTRSTLDVSLYFVKGFSVLQSTGSTLDISLPFVVKGMYMNILIKIFIFILFSP